MSVEGGKANQDIPSIVTWGGGATCDCRAHSGRFNPEKTPRGVGVREKPRYDDSLWESVPPRNVILIV